MVFCPKRLKLKSQHERTLERKNVLKPHGVSSIVMLVKDVDNFVHQEESCPLVLDRSWRCRRPVKILNLGRPCLVRRVS